MADWSSLFILLGALACGFAVSWLNVLALVGTGLGSGYWPSLAAACGAALGFSILVALVVFDPPFVEHLTIDGSGAYWSLGFKLAAGALLGYIAYRYWKIQTTELQAFRGSLGLNFLSQLTIMLGSPIALISIIALVGTTSTLSGQINNVVAALLVALTAGLAVVVMSAYAVLVSYLRKFLSATLQRKRIYQSAAVIMAWAAVCVLVR